MRYVVSYCFTESFPDPPTVRVIGAIDTKI